MVVHRRRHRHLRLSGGSGSSGGSSGGTTGGTLGGSGGIGTLTPIAADFQLSGLLTDADAAQYLKASPTAGAPADDSTEDPATFDKDWKVGSSNAELRIQASNYKRDQRRRPSADFLDNISTLATEAKFEDQGSARQLGQDRDPGRHRPSSGLQHCQIEVLRGGLDVNGHFIERGSVAAARTDVVKLAKLVTERLPKR